MENKQGKWYTDLEEYIRQGEPDKAERSNAWKTAIGLQDVDGLKTSEYLLETAREHIEGHIDIHDAQKRIQSYYEERADRSAIENGTKEADIVSSRITALLSEKAFRFSPAEWMAIHRELFTGVFDHAGEIRTYNISKKEWVLNGESVDYTPWYSIKDTMDYDFNAEKEFSYRSLSLPEVVKHISKFTSGIWQIHPFSEGNTRSTAVFIIKYLKSFGFTITNDGFAENSWYFRNALVRANYKNYAKGIEEDTRFLELFFENVLMGRNNELKNRYLHVDYDGEIQSASFSAVKCQPGTLEETALLKLIADQPSITQKKLSELTGFSERTVKRMTVELQKKNYLVRVGGKRSGVWKVMIPLE